jgi:hypothetical protein
MHIVPANESAPQNSWRFPNPDRMNAFVKLPRDASTAMSQRNTLLAQPPSYFREFFNGRIPALHERLAWIEQQVLQSLSWELYRNDTYVVMIERTEPYIHLCIRRHDSEPCKNWKHHQQIKSELIGPEYEAVELFPAESRVIDTTNEYHLWAHPSPSYRFPFGFSWNRFITERPLAVGGVSHAA